MAPFILLAFVREDFGPSWAVIESAIRTLYYARVERKGEMERRLAACAPLAKAAKDRAAFDAAVDAMAAGFGDSHFDFLTDEEQGFYLMDGLVKHAAAAAMPQVGAWFRRAADGYTVQMVLEGGAAGGAGLRVGDVVVRADGTPFSPVGSLAGHVGKGVTLAFRRNGAEGEARVTVARSPVLRMFLDATLKSERTFLQGGKRIGYLHLWTQADSAFRKALAAAVAPKDLDGFVLDLRGGFGGGWEGYEGLFQPVGGAPAAYKKPLVVLIDRGSRSAKEVLSHRLQKTRRATLVGETTAGHVLATYPIRVNGWSYLEIPLYDMTVDGARLEGRGVTPDVAVDSLNGGGHDTTLEMALEILKRKG